MARECRAWRERRAAGLCLRCGAERTADGTTRFCPACAERHNAIQRKYMARKTDRPEQYTPEGKAKRRKPGPVERRQLRRENGLCIKCGSTRTADDEDNGHVHCEPCRIKQRRYEDAHNRRQRIGSFYSDELGTPQLLGGAVHLNAVTTVYATLDHLAQSGLNLLIRLHWRQEVDAARAEKRGPHLWFPVSRVVRAAIQYFGDKAVPKRSYCSSLPPVGRVAVRVDADTLAILKHHCQRNDCTTTETIRDMLIEYAGVMTDEYGVPDVLGLYTDDAFAAHFARPSEEEIDYEILTLWATTRNLS
jgi:hypothetical protein